MQPGYEIRLERHGDVAAIRTLTAAAFATARHASGTEAAIVDALRAAGALAVSLVAVEQGAVVCHVALSPITIDGRPTDWFGLAPVSVAPDRQGAGIGQALVRRALDRLRTSGAGGCVVLGDPGYYGRFGFRCHPGLRYPGPPPDYFQALAFRIPAPLGIVAYHPGFDAA